MADYPWNNEDLLGFSIIGMNHYHLKRTRHLFVAMGNGRGQFIKAEGAHERQVWEELRTKAKKLTNDD